MWCWSVVKELAAEWQR